MAFKLSVIPEGAPGEEGGTIQEDKLKGVEGSTIQLQRHRNPIYQERSKEIPRPSPGSNQSPLHDGNVC